MPSRSPLRALLLGALGATVFLAFSACDLDWSTRLDPVTPGIEGGPPADGPNEGAPIKEGSVDETSVPDAKPEAGSCDLLKADVQIKKIAARKCQFAGGGCLQAPIKDMCNCDVRVENTNDARASAFINAVKAFVDAGCDPKCAGTCTTLSSGQCLSQADGDGGTVFLCVPSN